jgi:hypothetical protein
MGVGVTLKYEAAFLPGEFVVLQRERHPDAGRIGQIVCRQGLDLLVEFFADDVYGPACVCVLPVADWVPTAVPAAKPSIRAMD